MTDYCISCVLPQSLMFAFLWALFDYLAKFWFPKARTLNLAHPLAFEICVMMFYPLGARFTNLLLYRLALGYFLYDVFLLVFFLAPKLDMLVHHWSVMIMMLYAGSTGLLENEILWILFLGQISSFFRDLRLLLKRTPYNKKSPYFAIQWAFVISFFVGRFGLSLWSTWDVMTQPDELFLFVKVSALLSFLVNLYWGYSIGRFVLTKLRNSTTKK